MDVVTKARLIDALQRQTDFVFIRRFQETVVELFRQTHGEDLTTLKGLLDEGGDFYNLHKLIFQDLDRDLSELAKVHIVEEASELTRGGGEVPPMKVLSDVDDTLYCSAGHFPAGVDKRFPKRQVYPGVLALYRELGQRDS